MAPDPEFELALFEQLRERLHAGGAWAHYVIDSEQRHPTSGRAYQEAIWFPVHEPAPVPDGRRKVFFTVNPCSQIPPTNARGKITEERWRHSQNEYIGAVNCLYAEWDAKDFGDDMDAAFDHIVNLPELGIPAPSCLSNSGGGYQGYWLLSHTFAIASEDARKRASDIQAAWVDLVSGDPGVHDLRRILRVPGTWNVKEKYGAGGLLCHFVEFDLTRRYALRGLETLLPKPEPEPDYEALERYERRAAGTSYGDEVVRRYIDDELDREHKELAYQVQGGRSHALIVAAMRLGGILKAEWASGLLQENDIESALISAAERNGLVRDYGRHEMEREIANGIRQADARIKPNLRKRYPEHFGTNGRHRESESPGEEGQPESAALDLLQFEATDEGNAEAVYSVHGPRFCYVDEWGWLYYTGTHWTTNGAEAALGFAVVDTLRERRAQAVGRDVEAIVKCAKPNRARVAACVDMLTKHVRAQTSDFDQEAHLLNVANGVLNLRTGRIIPHYAGQRFTYCVSVPYNPEADMGDWCAFLGDVIAGGPEVIAYLQEAVGYSLTGSTREECLFYIHGPTRSGKGTFTETLLRVLGGGTQLASEVPFDLFATQAVNPDAQNFALAPLKPCRMVFASESGRYQMLNEAKVKGLTGGNDVRCCFKGKDHFSYRPQFKIWLSSNEKPKGDVDDDALWLSRLKVIEFPRSFVGQEDKTLKRRLRTPANLEGVLRWAVEGARRWYAKPQGLTTPGTVQEATQASRDELDTVKQWLDECGETAADDFVSNAVLRASYENWCKANGHKPLGDRMLSRSLAKKGYVIGERESIGGTQQRVVRGLRVHVGTSEPTF